MIKNNLIISLIKSYSKEEFIYNYVLINQALLWFSFFITIMKNGSR